MEEIRRVKVKIRELSCLLKELEEKIVESCDHEYEKEIPQTVRDNGEFYYRCRKCNYLSS